MGSVRSRSVFVLFHLQIGRAGRPPSVPPGTTPDQCMVLALTLGRTPLQNAIQTVNARAIHFNSLSEEEVSTGMGLVIQQCGRQLHVFHSCNALALDFNRCAPDFTFHSCGP